MLAEGHEEERTGLKTVFLAGYDGVVHAVAALVGVEWRLDRLPSGAPHGAAVVDVEVAAACIHGHAVVAVAGDAAELGVLVEAITAGGVTYEGEKILVSEIVYPGPRSARVGDDVLACLVVEMSVFHRWVFKCILRAKLHYFSKQQRVRVQNKTNDTLNIYKRKRGALTSASFPIHHIMLSF